MTLMIGNYTVIGSAQELVEFIKEYEKSNQAFSLGGNISDLPLGTLSGDFEILKNKGE